MESQLQLSAFLDLLALNDYNACRMWYATLNHSQVTPLARSLVRGLRRLERVKSVGGQLIVPCIYTYHGMRTVCLCIVDQGRMVRLEVSRQITQQQARQGGTNRWMQLGLTAQKHPLYVHSILLHAMAEITRHTDFVDAALQIKQKGLSDVCPSKLHTLTKQVARALLMPSSQQAL